MMKHTVCIAGKNSIAIETMQYLLKNNFDRFELLASCNRTETGKNSWQKSYRKFLLENNIREVCLEELYEIDNLVFLSTEYDRLIKTKKFKPGSRLYNIHFSCLPAYKGMYTSVFPILNGDEFTGVTLHEIDDGIDTGNIIVQKLFKINNSTTCRDLYLEYLKNGIALIKENLEDIIEGKYKAQPQMPNGSTYYSKNTIDYSNLKIDVVQTADMIGRQIRAFSFREYQMPEIDGKKIISFTITQERSFESPGVIVDKNNQGMKIGTIDYYMWLFYDRFAELIKGCEQGNIEAVKDICFVKEHINQAEIIHGWTPLMVATYNNQIEIVKYLLDNGADVNAVNYNGTNLLMYAKDAFLKTNDSTLLELYLNWISPYKEDYSYHNLFYYIDGCSMASKIENIVKNGNLFGFNQ